MKGDEDLFGGILGLSDYSTSTKFIRAVSFINFVLIWLL
jgi:hypothetical protein